MRVAILLGLAAVLAGGAAAGERNFWEGKKLPSMSARTDQWVNVSRGPRKRGRVIWIQFGELEEIRCRDLDSQLVTWDKKYRNKGLLIIEVFDGTKDRQADVEKHARAEKKKFPVLWDKEAKLVKKFRIKDFPTCLLVDRYGKILWVGDPHAERASLRSWIERELARPGPKTKKEGAGPEWLTEKEAFERAKEDEKWVFLFKWSPASPAAQKLRKTLQEPAVVDYLEEHCHCVVADHPKYSARARGQRLWDRSDLWDEKVVLWLIRFDGRKHVPVDHLKDGKAVDPATLVKRLGAVK